jgi:hypothetical protein
LLLSLIFKIDEDLNSIEELIYDEMNPMVNIGLILKSCFDVKSQANKKLLFKQLLFVCFLFSCLVSTAQQQLQLGDISTTSVVNGSTLNAQTATLVLKSSAGTYSFYNPAVQITVSLSNQQYTSLSSSIISTNTATSFGSTVNNYASSVTTVPTFNYMNTISNPNNLSFSSSAKLPLNSGIDVASNKAFYIYNTAQNLFLANAPINGRYYYADLTVSFSKPVSNPVLQIVGLGGNILFSNSDIQGFSTDLELQNSAYTLSKLSGTNELLVTTNTIKNNNNSFGFESGNGAASGSILVSGTNITTLTFKLYLKGDGNGSNWSHSSVNSGDEFMLGVSIDKPISISGNIFNDLNGLNDNTVNGIGTNLSNALFVNLVDTAGKIVAAVPVNSNGTYIFEAVSAGNYTTLLSTIQGVQGNSAPLPTLPNSWVNVGEHLGNTSGNDGNANGILPIIVDTIDIQHANFGIAQCNTITSPSANQIICATTQGNNITVNTLLNTNIRFVKFNSNQVAGLTPTATEWNNIVNGTNIANVVPTGAASPFIAAYNFSTADFPNTTNAPITYYVYAINATQLGTNCMPYQVIQVTVNPKPTVANISGNATVCVGSTTTLSNSILGGVWRSSNTNLATVNNAGVVTGVSAGNATISYVITSVEGCKDSATQLITVVSPASLPTITASGPTTACLGTGLTLSSSTSATYQWYKDGVAISGATNQTFVPTVSGTYTMVIVAGGGACNAISNAINVTINYAATPSIAPAGDTIIICTKVNEKICPAIWGYSNYQWYKDGVAIAAPLGTASCFYPTQPGRYTLTAQDGAGCWSQASAAANIKIDTTCTGNVTGGNGGGVENKPLGDVIAQRLYGNAINSVSTVFDYSKATAFVKTHSIAINGGAGSLQLSNIIPTSTINTNKTFISTPTDLVNFTNAIDIFSVDYLQNNNTRAVALATKTLGEVYSHTKAICDRLKEAELFEVKKVNVRGFDLILSKLKQVNGEVEYVINFSLGLNKNRNTFGLQSNWLTDNYAKEDTMYNFQLWGASYNTALNMASDVLAKMDSVRKIVALANNVNDLPIVYVSKGVRNVTNIELSIYNPTVANSIQMQFVEKKNELANPIRKSQNYNISSFATSKITIPVSDLYEHNLYMYVNGKLVDLVYISDGSWTADYDKNLTTLNKFNVTNETATTFVNTEYPLLRNVELEATTKLNVSAYKLIKASGLSKDLSEFKGIKFNAAAKGTTTLKITILKRGITSWDDQYTHKLSITDNAKEYAVGLDKFVSKASSSKLNPNDITAVIFTWENNRGVNATIGGTLSKVRFTKDDISFEQAILNKEVTVYPNPNNGKFNVTFMAQNDGPLVLKIIDVAKGAVVDTKFINAKKGSNTINVVTNIIPANLSTYYILLEGDDVKYVPKKILINK